MNPILGDPLPDDGEWAHWDVGHGAKEDVDEDGEEGGVDPHHRVNPRQQTVGHTLQYTLLLIIRS